MDFYFSTSSSSSSSSDRLLEQAYNIRFDSLRLLYILCHSSLHYDNLSSNMHECVLAEVSALERWIWAAVEVVTEADVLSM